MGQYDGGMMRWEQSVGLVPRHRIHPDLQENLTGGVGLVCGMKRGICSVQLKKFR